VAHPSGGEVFASTATAAARTNLRPEGLSHRNMLALPPVRASRNSIEPKLGVPNKHHKYHLSLVPNGPELIALQS